jgi:hypothetical protein
MQQQTPTSTTNAAEVEKLFLKPTVSPKTQLDPNGALWSLLMLARKFEEMEASGDLSLSNTAVKSVCDPHLPVAIVAGCLGLDQIHPGPLGEIEKLWDNLYSAKRENPQDVTAFIFNAYQLIAQFNASSQAIAHNN